MSYPKGVTFAWLMYTRYVIPTVTADKTAMILLILGACAVRVTVVVCVCVLPC